MKKFTKELGPGWITLVENDDYALCRLDRAPGHLYAAAGARRERL